MMELSKSIKEILKPMGVDVVLSQEVKDPYKFI